jgi:hypothetical protein
MHSRVNCFDCQMRRERLDLLTFLKRDFMPMNLMCDRAGMFEERIHDRTKALFKYFNLPFNTEPPPENRFE